MSYFYDLGGAPANEDCASLGHTPDFDTINAFEVLAYKLAVIARFGPPPAGCRLAPIVNRHEFGHYRTLVLHVENEEDEAVQAYAELAGEGLGSWVEAGFAPPVTYAGTVASIPRPDLTEVVIGALLTTRPDPGGHFPVPEFAMLHGNLAAAFPEQAEAARVRLAVAAESQG